MEMIYLCCDTNIWINISNGYEPPRLLNRLKDEMKDGNIILLLPEIVIKEWERNKHEAIINQTIQTTNKHIESLKKLNQFLEADEFDWSFFWDFEEDENVKMRKLRAQTDEFINGLIDHKSHIIKKAKTNIDSVESIFRNPNTIILPADSKSSMEVMRLAVEKKFPFENDKNNFADALIFYQFINYLKDNGIEKGHFVTSNRKEFFPNKTLHISFQNEIEKTKSYFYKSLSEALNKALNEELVNLRELKRIEDLAFEIDLDDYYCNACYDGENRSSPIINHDHSILIIDNRSNIENDKSSINLKKRKTRIINFEDDEKPDTEVSLCDHCGTEHIFCPQCDALLDFQTYKVNAIQNCSDCNLKFRYNKETDRKGMITESYLELLD